MIRMLLFFAVLLAAALGFGFLMDTPGHVVLSYGGYDYQLSLPKAVVLLVFVSLAIMLVWSLIRFVFRLPGLLSMANRMRRRARGYAAVSRGLISVGTGNHKEAARYAGEAERLLPREPMSLLLKAQAAQLSGDQKVAESTFKRMLDAPETRVLGLRGLYVEARRKGNDAARAYAEEAFRLAPSAGWAGEAVLEYRCADNDWRGAIAVVEQNASRRLTDRDTARRQKAALLSQAAQDKAESAPDEALALATEALKLNPGLVPAASLVARRYSLRGDFGKATKLLETAWKQNPHPELAEAYVGARGGDAALDRLKRARVLAKLTPGHREARLAVAKAALEAREFAAAREGLEALLLEKPTAKACILMAELEEKESGNQGAVRNWLSRASIAPRDPAWIADGHVSERWSAVSPVTGRVDAYEWKEPPQSLEASVRASIDADKFSPAYVPVIEIAPSVVESVADVETPVVAAPTEPPVVPPAPTEAVKPLDIAVRFASAPAASPDGADFHAPDDPGPRIPEKPKSKRWGIF